MTDCIADEQSLEDLGLAGESAHDGMFKSARNIQNNLDEHNLLQLLLAEGSVPADHMVRVDQKLQDCRGYDLVVCGHSLGAGTAALLTMMLRPRWPGVHCYAYSPPGGLLSENAAMSTCDYITSVILGDDFIGRLSMRSMELLKDEMVECLAHSSVPKHKVRHHSLSMQSERFALTTVVVLYLGCGSDCHRRGLGLMWHAANVSHCR